MIKIEGLCSKSEITPYPEMNKCSYLLQIYESENNNFCYKSQYNPSMAIFINWVYASKMNNLYLMLSS